MSAFALPISPPPLTGMASQTYGTPRYRTVVSCRSSVFRQVVSKAVQHAGDLGEFVLPGASRGERDVLKIGGIVAPQSGFIGRTDRHREIAAEFDVGSRLPAGALHQEGTDRFGGAPNLIGHTPILLHPRPVQTDPVQLQRQPIRTLEDLKLPRISGHRLLPV